jgi:very-short-patch-repair endonuclease
MSGEVENGDHRGPEIQLRRLVGPKVAVLAARQHGAVARRQLVRLGLTGKQVRYLITAGLLHPVHRGVYALGHPRLTRQGDWMAAVLAGGPGAVLSHQSAAIHWQLMAYDASLPHITTSRKGRRRPGIRHHTASLPDDEVTIRDGVPVTTAARTLLDLATCLDSRRLERAIAEAQYRRYADSPSLPALIERYRGRRGIAGLRAILTSNRADLGPTRSGLEETFLRFLDARRLARPELNAPLQLGDGFVVADCLWRSQRIAVELDGRAAHLRAARGESDRVRDRRLLVAGWKPARVTARQLRADPDGLEADLRTLGVGDRSARGVRGRSARG